MTYYLRPNVLYDMTRLIASLVDGTGRVRGRASITCCIAEDIPCDSEGLRMSWRVNVCYGKRTAILYAKDRKKAGVMATHTDCLGYIWAYRRDDNGTLTLTLGDYAGHGRHTVSIEARA